MPHGPTPQSHNPLNDAARQAMHAAKETQSPLLEKMAIYTMIGSAVVTTALGVIHTVRMVMHDQEKAEEKAYRRLKAELDARERAREPARGHAR